MPSSKPETQTAYQRWEIGSLTDEYISAEKKLSQELIIAHDKGYQVGLEEGRNQGIAEGIDIGKSSGHAEALEEGRIQNAQLFEQFVSLSNNFELEMQQVREHTAQQVLALCLNISKTMVNSALSVHPELILPVIDQAIQNLPSTQLPVNLYLNNVDIELVKQAMGEQLKQDGWRLISDNHIEPGGCRLETPSNIVDATLPSRWQELLNTLDWLK